MRFTSELQCWLWIVTKTMCRGICLHSYGLWETGTSFGICLVGWFQELYWVQQTTLCQASTIPTQLLLSWAVWKACKKSGGFPVQWGKQSPNSWDRSKSTFRSQHKGLYYLFNFSARQIYKQAEECISLLATKLSEKEFFFGSSPSSLDAVVFAHLAPLLKAPLPSAALQNHLKACPNLTRFVSRILQRYFPKELQGDPMLQLFRSSCAFFKFSL